MRNVGRPTPRGLREPSLTGFEIMRTFGSNYVVGKGPPHSAMAAGKAIHISPGGDVLCNSAGVAFRFILGDSFDGWLFVTVQK